MTLVTFCEDYSYEYDVIVYPTSNAVIDGKLSKCSKCKEQNQIGHVQMDTGDA